MHELLHLGTQVLRGRRHHRLERLRRVAGRMRHEPIVTRLDLTVARSDPDVAWPALLSKAGNRDAGRW